MREVRGRPWASVSIVMSNLTSRTRPASQHLQQSALNCNSVRGKVRVTMVVRAQLAILPGFFRSSEQQSASFFDCRCHAADRTLARPVVPVTANAAASCRSRCVLRRAECRDCHVWPTERKRTAYAPAAIAMHVSRHSTRPMLFRKPRHRATRGLRQLMWPHNVAGIAESTYPDPNADCRNSV